MVESEPKDKKESTPLTLIQIQQNNFILEFVRFISQLPEETRNEWKGENFRFLTPNDLINITIDTVKFSKIDGKNQALFNNMLIKLSIGSYKDSNFSVFNKSTLNE